MAYGYDPVTGYQPATVAELLAEIETEELTDIDAELDTASDEPIGQLNGIMATKIATCHELTQTAFSQFDDTKCEGVQLQALSALTGTFKKGAAKGTVTLSCALTIGATLVAGTHVARVAGDETNRWTPKANFTAPSTGLHAVVFECERTGEVEALAGTITTIVTPLAGWTSVTNPLDATPGRDDEKDTTLRLRRRAELRAQGACSVPAIAADLLKVSGVIAARVYENATNVTVAGRPPHSLEAVIWDGIVPAAVDATVRETVFKNKPAGIQSLGSVVGSVTDEFGKVHNILFSRATQKPITIAVTLTKDPLTYAGDAAVEAALVADGALYTLDQDVIRAKLIAIVMSVKGVLDVTALTLNILPNPPGTANIAIGEVEIATFDTSRITVAS